MKRLPGWRVIVSALVGLLLYGFIVMVGHVPVADLPKLLTASSGK